MWTCSKCGEKIEDQFDSCWKCSTPRNTSAVPPPIPEPAAPKWRVEYKMFRGFDSWIELFGQARDFANEVGADRVLNISHSVEDDDGVVVVWYLENADFNRPP
jgi:hypothetical protein